MMPSLHGQETAHLNHLSENNHHHNSSCWGEHPLEQKNSLQWQLQMPEYIWQLNLSRPACPSLPWEWRCHQQHREETVSAQGVFHLPKEIAPITLQLLPKLPGQNLLWTLPTTLNLLSNQSFSYRYWVPVPLWIFPQITEEKEIIILAPLATHPLKPGVFWRHDALTDRYLLLDQHLEWREKFYPQNKNIPSPVQLDQGYVWTSVNISLHSKKTTPHASVIKRLLFPTTLMTLYRHRTEQEFISDQLEIEIDLDRQSVRFKVTPPEEAAAQLSIVHRPWNFERSQIELPQHRAIDLLAFQELL